MDMDNEVISTHIRRIETFRQQQQQQQTMSNVSNCITSRTTTSMKNQIQQPVMPLHDEPSQSTCPELDVQTQIWTASITQKSPVKDFENKQIKLENEMSISKNSKVKPSFKRKINNSERKKHRNAEVYRLVYHKTPLMIFSELFKDIPIKSQENSINIVTGYTATIKIDGQIYTANHSSETQAKQKACENFLRSMLAKEMIESKEKEESPMKIDKEDGEIGTVSNTKKPLPDNFLWPHFASLAMHNLMEKWEIQPVSEAINLQEEEPKANPIRQFPEDPKKYNPTQLLNEMKPSVKFSETINSLNKPSVFQVQCEIDNIPFTGQRSTKKAAKKECCIAAIKYFWQFDFHAIENDFPTKK